MVGITWRFVRDTTRHEAPSLAWGESPRYHRLVDRQSIAGTLPQERLSLAAAVWCEW